MFEACVGSGAPPCWRAARACAALPQKTSEGTHPDSGCSTSDGCELEAQPEEHNARHRHRKNEDTGLRPTGWSEEAAEEAGPVEPGNGVK